MAALMRAFVPAPASASLRMIEAAARAAPLTSLLSPGSPYSNNTVFEIDCQEAGRPSPRPTSAKQRRD